MPAVRPRVCPGQADAPLDPDKPAWLRKTNFACLAANARLALLHTAYDAVVSMPCWNLFEARPAAERAAVLGTAPRLGIEAAARLGWDRWTGDSGGFLGMAGYGASGAEADLWRHFGLTPQDAARAARALLVTAPAGGRR